MRDSKNGKITIYGDGEQVRDFIHVYDVVAANKFWIGREDGWGEAYNCGTETPHSINEVAAFFPVERDYQPGRKGDPTFSSSTIYKFKQLGWEPKVSFEDGVKILFDSYEK
jgi:UDP-glucose 4-epimerase